MKAYLALGLPVACIIAGIAILVDAFAWMCNPVIGFLMMFPVAMYVMPAAAVVMALCKRR